MTSEKQLPMTTFSVCATIDGRKTETRRVIRPDWLRCLDLDDPDDCSKAIERNPYGQPGDRLWVREPFETMRTEVEDCVSAVRVRYVADGSESVFVDADKKYLADHWHRRPWRHMPKIYARLFLRIEKIWIERVQQITGDGAIAEGALLSPSSLQWAVLTEAERDKFRARAIEFFANEWDRLNARRGFPWKDNPSVFAIRYAVDECLVHT